MQILLYDSEGMHVLEVVGYFPQPIEFTEYDVTMLEDICSRKKKLFRIVHIKQK